MLIWSFLSALVLWSYGLRGLHKFIILFNCIRTSSQIPAQIADAIFYIGSREADDLFLIQVQAEQRE